jgi:hypothetical protein
MDTALRNLLPQICLWIQPWETYCHKYVYGYSPEKPAATNIFMDTALRNLLPQIYLRIQPRETYCHKYIHGYIPEKPTAKIYFWTLPEGTCCYKYNNENNPETHIVANVLLRTRERNLLSLTYRLTEPGDAHCRKHSYLWEVSAPFSVVLHIMLQFDHGSFLLPNLSSLAKARIQIMLVGWSKKKKFLTSSFN